MAVNVAVVLDGQADRLGDRLAERRRAAKREHHRQLNRLARTNLDRTELPGVERLLAAAAHEQRDDRAYAQERCESDSD